MTESVLRLDRSKQFSECHGERTSDDPQYRVVHWQGGKLRGHIILLPFDSHDELVPDDGKTEKFKGAGLDRNGNPIEVTYEPLYSPMMREYLGLKLQSLKNPAAAKAAAPGFDDGEDEGLVEDLGENRGAGVDLGAWLKGHTKYEPHQVRTAIRERFGLNVRGIRDIVIALVLDEQIVPEGEVCAEFAKLLPEAQAA
jgi:hypothetical protein